MNYDEQFEQAEEEGKVDFNSVEIVKWEEAGQKITGELLGVEVFQGNQFDEECNAYLVGTDTGPVTFVLGAATDKRLQDLSEGMIIRVTYRGQKEIGNKKHVNIFEVKSIRQPNL
jgi:hypothetical protein